MDGVTRDRLDWLYALLSDFEALRAEADAEGLDHPDPTATFECVREVRALAAALDRLLPPEPAPDLPPPITATDDIPF